MVLAIILVRQAVLDIEFLVDLVALTGQIATTMDQRKRSYQQLT